MEKLRQCIGFCIAFVIWAASCAVLLTLAFCGIDAPGVRFSAFVMMLGTWGYMIGWNMRDERMRGGGTR